jgi:hypothetical protein
MDNCKRVCWWLIVSCGLLVVAMISGCGGEKKDALALFMDDNKENDPESYAKLEEEIKKQKEIRQQQVLVDSSEPEKVCYYHNVGVEHEARYLEGPFEKEGSKDGYFNTWDWDSALALGASPAIFVGNVIALPAALIISPPWEDQVSRSVFEVVEPTHELPGEASGMARKEE